MIDLWPFHLKKSTNFQENIQEIKKKCDIPSENILKINQNVKNLHPFGWENEANFPFMSEYRWSHLIINSQKPKCHGRDPNSSMALNSSYFQRDFVQKNGHFKLNWTWIFHYFCRYWPVFALFSNKICYLLPVFEYYSLLNTTT